ncbi:vWA domain-containing protein [Longispora albida]|uniref:vWA domain-containing protein n=1 Tax=Longispora albida TaxID=203523 RepID=UPI000374F608|nr:vWA domain-containing protein [Longispora albida]
MQGFTYSVDLVLVVDATGSMSGIIERVKASALSFQSDLQAMMKEKNKFIDQLRVRLVVYRDFYADAPEDSLRTSPFYTLPDETEAFAAFVGEIKANGGGDEPETALEALASAMRSPWASGAARRRQVIVVWTDASAHPLEKDSGRKPSGYPEDAPASFDALTDLWEGQECMDQYAKRMVVFAPDAYAWTDIANHWENTAHYVSKAGAGLADRDYKSILDGISESI